MNIYDLPGPMFLALYCGAAFAAWIVTLVLNEILRPPDTRANIPADLHPYEVGYLAEGDEGAASLRVGGREVGVKPWAPSAPFTTVRRVSVKKGSQRFILSATDAWIQIRSPRMSLAGSGRFTLRFKGKGTHQIDSNQRVPWNGRRLLRVGDTGQATTRSTR